MKCYRDIISLYLSVFSKIMTSNLAQYKEKKFCPTCNFLGTMGFMHMIACPSHVLVWKSIFTTGKMLNFVT